MEVAELVVNEYYKTGNVQLQYMGKEGNWFQFSKIGSAGVWMEVLQGDLWMIESAY